MLLRQMAPLFGVACVAFLASALPADASILSGGAAIEAVASSPSSHVQLAAHGAPAGKRCIEWTRRWNTRHGVGHRRCVRWR